MKIRMFVAALCCISIASQAALLDDFESYTAGNAENASPPWMTTEGGGTNFVADIWNGVGSQTLSLYGNGDYRDISRSVDGTFGGVMTNEFDVYVNGQETGVDNAFGLSDLDVPGWYADFGPIVRITTDTNDTNGEVSLDVYDGGYQDDIAALSIDTWYTIKLVADTVSQTYDVFVDDVQVYTNAAFRKAIAKVSTWGTMASGGVPQYLLLIDNLTFGGSGVPFEYGATIPANGATSVTNTPTLETTIILGTDTSLSSITLYLDDVSKTNLSSSAPTTTVSYAVTTPLAPLTVHTAKVVAVGSPSGTALTNTWTFTTETVGEYFPAGYTLYDDFESYPDSGNRWTNNVTTAGKWLALDNGTINPSLNTGLCDVEDDGSDTFIRYGWTGGTRGFVSDIPDIPEGSSGSYFFKMKTQDGTPDLSMGISDKSITNTTGWTWSDFEIQIALTGTINLGARNAGAVSNLISGVPVDTWLNIQVDIYNNVGVSNDTYDVYASFGGDTPALMASGLSFRNGTSDSLTTFFAFHNTAQADRSACIDDVYYNFGGGPVLDPFGITQISVAGGNATITWESQAGATYNILSKAALSDGWTTNASGIASAGDGTTSDSVTISGTEEFFQVEGQ